MRYTTIAFFLVLTQCQSYPFQQPKDGQALLTQHHEYITQSSNTDILFVIDTSGSMQDKQEDLRKNAQAFIDEISRANNDYRIGIVSTDMFAPDESGRLRLV